MLTPPVGITLADYNTAILNGNPTHARVVFPVQNITLTDDDISSEGGITLTQMLNPDDDLTIGRAVSTEIVLHFLKSNVFTGFNWSEEFHVDFGVDINGTTQWVTVGYYQGKKPERVTSVEVIEFVAHDRMQIFDTLADDYLDTVTYPVTMENLYHGLCTFMGVNYIVGDEIADAMAISYASSPFIAGMTCRALLAYIAEANGCYARITAGGDVQLKWFTDVTSSYSLTKSQYYDINIDEADAPTIDTIQIVNTDDENGGFIYPISGNTVIYQSIDNPLFLAMGGGDKTTVITDILTRFSAFGDYTPVSMNGIGNWMVESGDIIEVEHDNSQTTDVPVFGRVFSWNGGGEDSYSCTGKTARDGLSESAKQKYEIGAKVANKYTIQSGIDITNDGITVSGGKWVKIISGGTFDVNATNFRLDSINKEMQVGQWFMDQYEMYYTDPYNECDYVVMHPSTPITSTNYVGIETLGYPETISGDTVYSPSFAIRLNNGYLQTAKYIAFVYRASDNKMLFLGNNDLIVDGLKSITNIGSISGDAVANNVTTTTAGYVLDARQGTELAKVFVKSGSGAKKGLVPAPSTTAGTTKYLREDCTWQVPPNTNTNTWRGYQTKTWSYTYTLNAGASLNVTGTNLGISTPSGYTPVAVVRITTEHSDVVARSFNCLQTGGNTVVALHNIGTSKASSKSLSVTILYLQTGSP